jgi:alkaline phosphatase
MTGHTAIGTVALGIIFASQCMAQAGHARNVILFMGEGTGVSSLNAASIYGYNKPQSLYIQRFPGLGLPYRQSA